MMRREKARRAKRRVPACAIRLFWTRKEKRKEDIAATHVRFPFRFVHWLTLDSDQDGEAALFRLPVKSIFKQVVSRSNQNVKEREITAASLHPSIHPSSTSALNVIVAIEEMSFYLSLSERDCLLDRYRHSKLKTIDHHQHWRADKRVQSTLISSRIWDCPWCSTRLIRSQCNAATVNWRRFTTDVNLVWRWTAMTTARLLFLN